ncbi:hypothetical protein [Alloactinosynnema sp. L-07]|uniref:ribbon-helix-helix protein, CopG family n=1 Tax=Alloactinosynnema sp. L-07 TaxID=1653480 RepID=UPI00065F018B|nr:ribbon-helix-helix protein, CopG family [Alloactinosynnema sp. L-07]CRK59197.1 hypothetical protein [Alloactinosynnema sp. L-07]
MTYQKISVNLPVEVLEALREMAERDNLTQTEVLRRAISALKFISDAHKAGQAILLRDPSTKETERLVFY